MASVGLFSAAGCRYRSSWCVCLSSLVVILVRDNRCSRLVSRPAWPFRHKRPYARRYYPFKASLALWYEVYIRFIPIIVTPSKHGIFVLFCLSSLCSSLLTFYLPMFLFSLPSYGIFQEQTSGALRSSPSAPFVAEKGLSPCNFTYCRHTITPNFPNFRSLFGQSSTTFALHRHDTPNSVFSFLCNYRFRFRKCQSLGRSTLLFSDF